MPYATRALVNTYLADKRLKRPREVLTGTLPECPVEWREPETRTVVLGALATLPPRGRAVVVLRYWADLSVEQVAAVLGCSPGNVKSQSAPSLDKLRAVLGDTMTDSGSAVVAAVAVAIPAVTGVLGTTGAAPGTGAGRGPIAYVTHMGQSQTVTPIALATDTPGRPIQVGESPDGTAITPDQKTAYVTNAQSDTVTPITIATNTPGQPIKVGISPEAIAITP